MQRYSAAECLVCGVPGCKPVEHDIDAIEAALDNPWNSPVEDGELEDALEEARSARNIEQFASRIDAAS